MYIPDPFLRRIRSILFRGICRNRYLTFRRLAPVMQYHSCTTLVSTWINADQDLCRSPCAVTKPQWVNSSFTDVIGHVHRECRERFPTRRLQRKPLVSDPGLHHGTCGKHVPWCMSGSLTCCGGENIPGACAPAILRIWQEAHSYAGTWKVIPQSSDIDIIHGATKGRIATNFSMS